MPDAAPDGPLGGTKGLLSPIGDPIGQVLDKGLKPIGSITGAIGRPNGQALLDLKEQAKKETGGVPPDTKPGGAPLGGKPQTGENPLGL